MSCLHPMMVIYHPKPKGFLSKWKYFTDFQDYDPEKFFNFSDNGSFSVNRDTGEVDFLARPVKIPCGQCVECRLAKSRDWATRCVLEAKQYEFNYIVTLTYDDEHLPMKKLKVFPDISIRDWSAFNAKLDKMLKSVPYLDKESKEDHYKRVWNMCEDFQEVDGPYLVKSHMQTFMKLLRKRWSADDLNHVGIRFFGCGEYGEKHGRPHFHIALFNMPIPDLCPHPDPLYRKSQCGFSNWYSKLVHSCWNKGQIVINEVSWQYLAYIARYIMKKANGVKGLVKYEKTGLTPEFINMSRRPGIGSSYFLDHGMSIYDTGKIALLRGDSSVSLPLPRYARKIVPQSEVDDWFTQLNAAKNTFYGDLALLEQFDMPYEAYQEHQIMLSDIKVDQLKRL